MMNLSTVSEQALPSDEEIVRDVLAGEKERYELLVRRYNRMVYRAVRSIVRNEDDVEDVMQAAFVSAYFALARFRGDSRFSTWLVRIAIHEAFARVRQSRRFVADGDRDLMSRTISSDQEPDARAADRELGRMLERAIDDLPQMYRAVFLMREVEGLDTVETAACLGLTAENVKVRLHRARSRLRHALHGRAETKIDAAYPFHADRCDRVVRAVLDAIGGRR